jgi:hypothetical protein
MAGRGEREDISAPIVGTMLTPKRFSNIQDFELAVAGAEKHQRLFCKDYLTSLNLL